MWARSVARWFSYVVREVDANGFDGNFRQLDHVNAPSTRKLATAAVQEKQNTLFCGHHGTGKLTLLKAIGRHCETELGLRVAYISADHFRANRLEGMLLHHFIGLRMTRDDLPSQEQLEGTIERHVRLVDSTYASCVPSLCSVDVLLLDAIEKIDPVVLLSMDAVCRRQHGKPHEPFGGLRVYGTADFWRLRVHPTSDTGGYLFQLDSWKDMFPRQHLLHRTHGQEKQLNRFTTKALFGSLSVEDMRQMEALSRKTTEAKSPPDVAARPPSPNGAETPERPRRGGRSEGLLEMSPTPQEDTIISNAVAISRFKPRFPKQPTMVVMPTRYRQLKQTGIGNFLVNMLIQSSTSLSFGMVESLSVEVGDRVHLLVDGRHSFGVPAGAVGEVTHIKEHAITVHFPSVHRTVDILRMRITCYHPTYPEVRYEIRQFPLFPRQRLCPWAILLHPHAYHMKLNGRCMTDTNDLGNILAHMRSFDDFTLCNTSDIAHLDGIVHEPTRIYYHQITGEPLSTSTEQWCRNCKVFVPTKEFFSHWASCVKAVRWCGECNKVVPLELLEPHREKHQVVLCMDCGQAVEWRHWEAHRLSCGAMMREVSPDNEFLPMRTRQLALELGLDRRDLHTMRPFSKSMLPKSRSQIH